MLKTLKARPSLEPTPFEMPTIASASVEYPKLLERLAQLQTTRAELSAEADALARTILNALKGDGEYHRQERQDRVAKLVAGAAIELGAGPSLDHDRERQAKLACSIDEIDAALREINSQIFSERMKASATICDQIRPEHKRLIADICAALAAVQAASLAYSRFTTTCNENGIAWSQLGPMFPAFIGDPKRNDTRLANYFHRAARDGFIAKSDIPQELRP